ncbi:hypothetical protein BKA70DRAFT_1252701 [Coprinopsis sp. MPI-PUGE-AT-0042]|nr:hypothetical protein BKA70DRAFT_1252701 [Coprinopsis sp. MPI-PUGE-AT-0042]
MSQNLQCSTDKSTEEVERRVVDGIIEGLEEQIRALKGRRNGVAPPSRLPPEVLARVFLFCRWNPFSRRSEPYRSYYQEVTKRPGPRAVQWPYVTFVCQRWRAVALDCAPLWCNISFDCSKSWTIVMLERSRHLPLRITVPNHPSDEDQAHAREILSDGRRLKELTIGVYYRDREEVSKTIKKLLSPSPSLEALAIHYSGSTLDTLPPQFLGDATPNLRRLTLINWVPLSWSTRLFSNLTHLKLRLTDTTSRPPPLGNIFLDALQRMTTLQLLDLEMQLPEIYEGTHVRPVLLLALKELVVGSTSMKGLAELLKYSTLPSETRLDLSCSVQRDDSDGVAIARSFASSLDSSWISGPPTAACPRSPIRYLTVTDVLHTNGTKISGSRSTPQESGNTTGIPPSHLQLTIFASTPSMNGFWESLPLSNLQHLVLGNDASHGQVASLAKLPEVKHITLEKFAYDIVKHIADGMWFPELKEITLASAMDLKFNTKRPGAYDPADLIHLLERRARGYRRIRKVNLGNSQIFKKDLARINDLIVFRCR